MSHTITRPPGAASRLLRHVDGVELPAAGTWIVPRTHATIEFSERRRFRRDHSWNGRAREAAVILSDDPGDVLVAVALAGQPLGTADPLLELVAHSVQGPGRWMLSGRVIDNAGVLPVSATLDYHGVWRRGARPYGWFVLAGAISEPAVARRRLRFRFELLAHPVLATG
jgi:hypothetical protein